jgi:hypothetical protein
VRVMVYATTYGAYELLTAPLREDYCLKQGFTTSKCGGSEQIHVILVPAKPSDLMYFVFLKCS